MTEQKQIPGPPEAVLKSVQRKLSTFLRELPEDERWAMPYALAAGTTPSDAEVHGYSAGTPSPTTIGLPYAVDICAWAGGICNAQCADDPAALFHCYYPCMQSYNCNPY